MIHPRCGPILTATHAATRSGPFTSPCPPPPDATYALLALVDALRIGQARVRSLAAAQIRERREADREARAFVRDGFRRLLTDARFEEAIPAHLLPDRASQSRVPLILERMHGVARGDGPNVSDEPQPTRSEAAGEED